MPVTDFSTLGNAVQVTINGAATLFFDCRPTVRQSADGTQLTITFNNPFPQEPSIYNVLLTDLRTGGGGTAPANLTAALTALSTVFPKANSGTGGSGSLTNAEKTYLDTLMTQIPDTSKILIQ